MTADNDIVDRLQSAGHFYAPPHDAILYEAAAEIVRLRGEAESMEQMARMQAARADAAEREVTHLRSIAPAEAKTPAPAMPNGVEGLMQLARNWCLAWGEWAHDADPGGANENAAEAELRAALTTALAKPPAEAFDPSIHPIPGEGQQPAMLNGAVALYGMFRALVDAGGAATVARHGAMPRPEALTEALQRGMLAIEHMFHPERFDDFPGTTPPAAIPEVANGGEVLVEVSGLTGSGKSAIAGEIEILCKALGLEVRWINGDTEKAMTHADWTEALELYKPRVRIVERNVPRHSQPAQESDHG